MEHFHFLRQYIEKLIDDSGAFDSLTEETRAEYIPQFMAEAERRIGLSILPHLDEAHAAQFAALVKDEATTDEQLQAFWKSAVPNLDEVVSKTLQAFADEFNQALQGA